MYDYYFTRLTTDLYIHALGLLNFLTKNKYFYKEHTFNLFNYFWK